MKFQAEIEQGELVCLSCVLLMNRTNEPVDNLFVNVFVNFITTESPVLFIALIWSDYKNSGSLVSYRSVFYDTKSKPFYRAAMLLDRCFWEIL